MTEPGIPAPDAPVAANDALEARLGKLGKTTWNERWSFLGDDLEHGVEKVAAAARVEPAEVAAFFRAEALRQAARQGGSGLGKHWIDALVFVLAVGILVLVLRDTGLTPWPTDTISVVANRDLKAGDTLRADTVHLARMPTSSDTFAAPADVQDLILARDVGRGQPLRVEQLLRAQVVAVSNIASDTQVLPANVAITWSPYARGALLSLPDALGHRARRALRAGEVIESGDLQPIPR